MKISKKCQYALKAVFNLAWLNNGRPMKTHDIAVAQRMSPRFTEIILNELKHGGFVESKRGNEGGYLLSRDPKDLTAREIIEYIQGPINVAADAEKENKNTAFPGNFAFKEFWQQLNDKICQFCDSKTINDLVELERAKRDSTVLTYNI